MDFPFTHDISGLTDLCEQSGIALPDELDGVDGLTPYAAALRYDDDQPGVIGRDAALKWAATAAAWAQEQVDAARSQAVDDDEVGTD
jgi:hypothetical protein